MIPVEERADLRPIRPHCEQPVQQVLRTPVRTLLGKAYLWACPRCRKVPCVTHRKGFWMG